MVVFFCMFDIVHHCFTVHSPVAERSFFEGFRQNVEIFFTEGEYHLEPELVPAVVAYWRSFTYFYTFLHLWRVDCQPPISLILKFTCLCQLQHLLEHYFYILFLDVQKVIKCIHLHFVISEIFGLYCTCSSSIAQQHQLGTIFLARRHIEVAKIRPTDDTLLIQFLDISGGKNFTTVMTFNVNLINLALESVSFLVAFFTLKFSDVIVDVVICIF